MIQFHLDENMPLAIASGLRSRGFNVTRSKDANLIGATDEEQLSYSYQENRVLITRDKDFLRLNAKGKQHTGIIFWTQKINPTVN